MSSVTDFVEQAEKIGASLVNTRTGVVAMMGSITVGYWNSFSCSGKIKSSDFKTGLDLSSVSSRFSGSSVLDISIQN